MCNNVGYIHFTVSLVSGKKCQLPGKKQKDLLTNPIQILTDSANHQATLYNAIVKFKKMYREIGVALMACTTRVCDALFTETSQN